jgi:predicted deacylase
MSTKKFSILGREIKKGESASIELEVAKQHTRNSITISIIVERAELDGPTLLLMGGVHGDETNGVAIVRDIIRNEYNIPKRGTIICIPILNVFGYLNLSREFPDGRDLNRMFPGSKNGSLASQFAYKFTSEIAPLVDYVIDYHTGGAERENFPNVRCVVNNEKEFQLAKVFGAPFIVNSDYLQHSIRSTITKMEKTMLLFEGGKSNSLDRNVIDCGVEGALNVMKFLKMRNGRISKKYKPVVIAKSKWIRSPHSGMFQFYVKNGTFVKKKEIIGKILDPYGEFEKRILAPFDCYLYAINMAPLVHRGDALFHVSVESEPLIS